ncbi:MAG: hypothetical protein N3E47_05925 [Candidatus Bathyarchaeota archaeon]|nr:hypothetical protein [Candidatus Bathyarchaeota archaeon]
MLISLSILEYESELSENMSEIRKTRAFNNIIKIIRTGKIAGVHIDVMRPPMIPNKEKFPVNLIRRLYEELHGETSLIIHLMVSDPIKIVEEINGFITEKERGKVTIILQVESFNSEEESIAAIENVRKFGYRVGIALNLPTPVKKMTDRIVEHADSILLMSVPMGAGGQKFSDEATWRIKYFSTKFPNKAISVDGGINPQTISKIYKAGAKVAVVGSYITVSEEPEKALLELEKSLKNIE